MCKSLAFLVLCFFFGSLSAQEAFRGPAPFKAMGNASVSLQSPLSIYSNPAGFAGFKKTAFGFQYENRFLLDELRTASAFLVFPVQRTNFGFSLSQFGNGSYRENNFSLGVAKKLSNRFFAGIQFHYRSLYLAENKRRAGTLAVDIGAQYLLFKDVHLGVQVFNPWPQPIQTMVVKFNNPMVLRFGLHKVFEESLLFAVEVRKQSDQQLEFNSGMEFRIREQVQLRMGIEARTALFSIGVGYSLKRIQTDLAFSYHQYLGYSPAFSIYYQLP